MNLPKDVLNAPEITSCPTRATAVSKTLSIASQSLVSTQTTGLTTSAKNASRDTSSTSTLWNAQSVMILAGLVQTMMCAQSASTTMMLCIQMGSATTRLKDACLIPRITDLKTACTTATNATFSKCSGRKLKPVLNVKTRLKTVLLALPMKFAMNAYQDSI